MNTVFLDYFKCPQSFVNFKLEEGKLSQPGFFCLNKEAVCYGKVTSLIPNVEYGSDIPEILNNFRFNHSSIFLPFNLTEIIDNLRLERYIDNSISNLQSRNIPKYITRNIYYFLRPLLPILIRKYFQKASLHGWEKKSFPFWPVDRHVETILETAFVSIIREKGYDKVPFIWFWPNGHNGCVIMTHDVETKSGRDFCSNVMDIERSYGIKSAFEVIPESRYEINDDYLESIRSNGCEICIHGLNHDGYLFSDYNVFLQRMEKINTYAKLYGVTGFRSPVMYRNLDWYNAFEFSYDMSVPNVGHLDPQHGGCCTVMPYFIGNVVELPLTTIQDYSLFNIIQDDSLKLWKQQIMLIREKYGLISFIVHPDYIISKKYFDIYKKLLDFLTQYCSSQNIWFAIPKEVDNWWRLRSKMELIEKNGKWYIEGSGKERAKIAYAVLENNRITYIK